MSHDHHHHSATKNLKAAFLLNLAFTVLEMIGGYYVNSVAIMSDAVHDLGDSLSLGTSWYLEKKSHKRADDRYSFGYRRFSLIGALLNSLVLIVGSTYVVYEAISRLITPESSDAQGMFFFALVGVSVNGYAAWRMSKGKTLNERVISWHLLEDVLGWTAVLIVSIVLLFKDIPYLDPALSLAITSIVLFNVVKWLRETLFIFLQGQPQNVNRSELEARILSIPFVESMHHTHIWSLDGENHVFSSHVKLEPLDTLDRLLSVKADLKAVMERYPFEHYTIETELSDEPCGMELDEGEKP